METLYDWLKRKKEQGNSYRFVTLMYDDSIMGHKKACIKPKPYGYFGHYMKTIMDETEPVYYEISYLLRFIEEDLLRDYYVTCEGIVKDSYSDILHSDRLAYKLEISDKIPVKPSNSHYGINPPFRINPLPVDSILDDHFNLRKAYNRIALDGIWKVDKKRLEIEKVVCNGPATVIFWKDGTKTIAKCDKDDVLDYEKGILYAALKKLCDKKEYNDILRLVDAWSEYNNLHPDLFPDDRPIPPEEMRDFLSKYVTEDEDKKPKKKVYKRKFGDSDQNCPNCGQNWIWSNNRRLSFFRDGFINITCKNCGHKFRYVEGGRYESQ